MGAGDYQLTATGRGRQTAPLRGAWHRLLVAVRRGAGLRAGLLLLGSCQAAAESPLHDVVEVAHAPAEIGLLAIEDRSPAAEVPVQQMQQELRRLCLDRGHTLLAPAYVAAAGIQADAPALGGAGLLRVRILDWDPDLGERGRLRYRLHASLYLDGRRLSDHLHQDTLVLGPAELAGAHHAEQRRARARLLVLQRLVRALPPPPGL